jgi:hypothetical protein
MLPTIEVPKYSLTIPSNGNNIRYRPYLVKEEKILLMALESQDDKMIDTAIKDTVTTCIVDDIDINELTNYDVEFLFLNIRSKSVGEKVKIIDPCDNEECDEEATITIDLDKIKVKNLNKIKENNRFKIGTNLIIDIKPLTLYDTDLLIDIPTEDSLVATVAASIDIIYDGDEIFKTETIPLNELMEFVNNMNLEQFNPILSRILNDRGYVAYEHEWICNKCGEKNTREYKGLSDFFI